MFKIEFFFFSFGGKWTVGEKEVSSKRKIVPPKKGATTSRPHKLPIYFSFIYLDFHLKMS